MKRIVSLLMVLMTLTLAVACYADTGLSGLEKALQESSYVGWNLINSLEIGNEAFLSIRKNEINRLLHAKKGENGNWKIDWSNESAMPQGSSDPEAPGAEHIMLISRSNSTYAGLKLKTAFSYRAQRNGCYEYIFQKHTNSWLLEAILYLDTDGTQLESYRVADETITYKGWQSNNSRTYVEGRVQRDLRYFSDAAFPKSLNALKSSLSNPPTIPSGTLSAEEIKFTGGKKYSVYAGPGENYLRGGNGKAAVSTNDWIQVFGRENGWIMIQYDITSDHMRIGWIKETALPKNTTVSELNFGASKAHTAVQCAMTDDPLFSTSIMVTVPAGAEVTWLATMGSWTYVEYESGTQIMRGFIQSNNLTALTEDQVKSLAKGTLLMTDSATVNNSEAAEELQIFCNYDVATGQWNVKIMSDKDNAYIVIVDDKTGAAWMEENENG